MFYRILPVCNIFYVREERDGMSRVKHRTWYGKHGFVWITGDFVEFRESKELSYLHNLIVNDRMCA